MDAKVPGVNVAGADIVRLTPPPRAIAEPNPPVAVGAAVAVALSVGDAETLSFFLPHPVRTRAPMTNTTVRLFFTKVPFNSAERRHVKARLNGQILTAYFVNSLRGATRF